MNQNKVYVKVSAGLYIIKLEVLVDNQNIPILLEKNPLDKTWNVINAPE